MELKEAVIAHKDEDRHLKATLERIFPELKESEDENIRKELICFLETEIPQCNARDKYIAWLEKQGEQKPAEFDDTNAKRMFIKALERVEEQNNKGYKLTDCDKNSWWEDFKAYTSCIVEQKPWSEEDEDRLNIEKLIRFASPAAHTTKEEALDWLKSLKERYTWKPSDEQMNALNYVVNLMASSERPTENDLYYNILKSLRQQLMKLK